MRVVSIGWEGKIAFELSMFSGNVVFYDSIQLPRVMETEKVLRACKHIDMEK
jgi:hypothetical protein